MMATFEPAEAAEDFPCDLEILTVSQANQNSPGPLLAWSRQSVSYIVSPEMSSLGGIGDR